MICTTFKSMPLLLSTKGYVSLFLQSDWNTKALTVGIDLRQLVRLETGRLRDILEIDPFWSER